MVALAPLNSASTKVLTSPAEAAQWLREHVDQVKGTLRTDSRQLQTGDGFLAWPGAAADGRGFVAAALKAGAAACLVEAQNLHATTVPQDPRVGVYPGLKEASGAIADLYFGQPSKQLDVAAVTGTNGKTSTTWWLAQALSSLQPQRLCAVAGTLGMGSVPGANQPISLKATGLTTPDPVSWQHALRSFVDAGFGACAVEASSIGLAEHRMAGTYIRLAVFTNLTQDHLDYHGDMAHYWKAKKALFDWPQLKGAVVSVDDPHGAELAHELQARSTSLDVWTVGERTAANALSSSAKPARLSAEQVRCSAQGMQFKVMEQHDGHTEECELSCGLVGAFNVSNLLCVLASLRHWGFSLQQAVGACAALTPVPGRMQWVQPEQGSAHGQPLGVVDYAHTPDALSKVLQSLRPLAQARSGRLWCVVGCGGGRDASKRPLMSAVAAQQADRIVLTSDNPRGESPEFILSQMLLGLEGHPNVLVESDRAFAIAYAMAHAAPQDVVLVAGKGHEAYQEVAGRMLPFSDAQEIQKALQLRQAQVMFGGAEAPSLIQAWLPQAQWVPAVGASHAGSATALGQPVLRVHTDTRTLQPGDLFVALQGERFDANQFLKQARASGAVAAICTDRASLLESGLPGWVVPDSLKALGQLATAWRAKFSLPVLAVTGSNGKTTVTQMIASILRVEHPQDMVATEGNLNNEIGVPLTLLRLRSHHRIAVVELGMNHPGEIARLAAMAQPTVALVNNAQREHQEFMATVQAVAQENGAVLAALPENGVAVFPAQDAFTPLWRDLAGTRSQVRFAHPKLAATPHALQAGQDIGFQGAEVSGQCHGLGAAWQVRATYNPLRQAPQPLNFTLQVAGQHNVSNALAAAACALAAGVTPASVEAGLSAFKPVKGRSRALALQWQGRALTVVDDTYNANPDSVRAAIEVLAALPAPRLLVLGDMGEVGDSGPAFHAEVGGYALSLGIEQLLALGQQTPATVAAYPSGQPAHEQPAHQAQHFEDIAPLLEAVRRLLPQVQSVLVKGSRFMRMERVVQAIEAWSEESMPPKELAHVA
jgi:murE/murF fusion protein